MKIDRRTFLFAAAASAGCRTSQDSGFPGNAFVANEEGRSIAVVDLRKFRVSREIKLEGKPTALASSPRRAAVYALASSLGSVYEIDPASFQISRKIRVTPSAANSMKLAPDGQSLWILSAESRSLIQLDLVGFQIRARIKLPANPEEFDLGSERAVVSFPAEGSIAVLNLRQAKPERLVATGPDVRTVRFHAQEQRVLCGNRGNRTLTIYDVAHSRIVAHLPLAVEPWNFCYKAVNDGEMYITGPGIDGLVVVYPYQNEVHETRLIGRSPGAMASSSEYLFVANTESGNVTVMDIVTGKIIAKVAVGAEPRQIVVTEDEQYALALNSRSGDMAVIDISAFRSAKTAKTTSHGLPPPPAPLFTMIPVGARPVSTVIRRG